MKTCRWCGQKLPGTTPESRNWWCQRCHKYDATACLWCGKTSVFPVERPWVTVEQAARSPFAAKERRLIEKAYVYCAWCYHDHFFTTRTADVESCVLCGTTWERGSGAIHPGIPVRGKD